MYPLLISNLFGVRDPPSDGSGPRSNIDKKTTGFWNRATFALSHIDYALILINAFAPTTAGHLTLIKTHPWWYLLKGTWAVIPQRFYVGFTKLITELPIRGPANQGYRALMHIMRIIVYGSYTYYRLLETQRVLKIITTTTSPL